MPKYRPTDLHVFFFHCKRLSTTTTIPNRPCYEVLKSSSSGPSNERAVRCFGSRGCDCHSRSLTGRGKCIHIIQLCPIFANICHWMVYHIYPQSNIFFFFLIVEGNDASEREYDKHQNGPGLTRLPPVAKTWASLRNAAENICISPLRSSIRNLSKRQRRRKRNLH